VLDLTLSHEFTLPTGQLGLAVYAKKHGLGAALYQDYGWPAKKLPPVE